MQDLLQCCFSSLLLIACLYVCNTSSQKNRVKTFEVPVNAVIPVTDGRQRYFNFTSEFIANKPLVKFESPEKNSRFYVSVVDTVADAKRFCWEPIKIRSFNGTKDLCHGGSGSFPAEIDGNFSIEFKLKAVNHSPTVVHVLRSLRNPAGGVCQNDAVHKCGRSCFGSDAMCDGQKHCKDGSDERNCSTTKSSTYSTTVTTSTATISTTPAGSRRCDLPGADLQHLPEAKFKKSWTVAAYSTGIIISTVFCSIVIGFCFMQPFSDNEDEQQEFSEGGGRRLDSFLDHPPSYEDVMNMDLSTRPRRHVVPKPETPETP